MFVRNHHCVARTIVGLDAVLPDSERGATVGERLRIPDPFGVESTDGAYRCTKGDRFVIGNYDELRQPKQVDDALVMAFLHGQFHISGRIVGFEHHRDAVGGRMPVGS